MKRTTTIVALAFVALAASTASAQTHDHFARQRQESLARVAAAQHQLNHGPHHGAQGHWGGVTTNQRYYNPSHGHGLNVQFYSVNPYVNPYGYGFGSGYGVPSYGNYGGGYPYYGAPYCAPGGTGIYIHREIYLGR